MRTVALMDAMLQEAIDTAEALRVLDASSEAMPPRNCSSPLLHFAPEGLPGRIKDTLAQIDEPKAFAEEPLPFLYQG